MANKTIYKTKKSYYTIEYRLDKVYKVKNMGYKIIVNDLTFFSDYKEYIHMVTEESTGAKVTFKTLFYLEDVEKYLIENYNKIKESVEKFKKENPELSLNKLEELKE